MHSAHCPKVSDEFMTVKLKEFLDHYTVFHGFGQSKFAYGGSILGSSQFTLLPQLPLNMMLSLKVVRIDTKISNTLH